MTGFGFKMAALVASAGFVGSAFAAPVVIDDGAAGDPDADGFSVTLEGTGFGGAGSGWDVTDNFVDDTSAPSMFNADQSFSNDPTATATYAFTGLVAGGTYNVYASWRDGQVNGQTDTGYTISDGGGTVNVNQQVGSAGDLMINETVDLSGTYPSDTVDAFPFQLLATVTDDGDGNITVTITPSGTNFALADAVAVDLVPEPGSLALLGLGGMAMLRRRRD